VISNESRPRRCYGHQDMPENDEARGSFPVPASFQDAGDDL
jgi:hypothetical protein